ncbi:MAG TPA: hypothetical protein VES20_17120 [Bryobacteraceae bacterium]|nr:hypothetical protein [Bryobacteraceae bacterium]
MKVKSFYGSSLKEALSKAQAELGPEATIVASRQLRAEEGGGCEVVCGIAGVDARPEPAVSTPAEAVEKTRKPSRVARIRKGIEAVRSAVVATPSRSHDEPEVDAVYDTLVSSGFSTDFASEVLSGVRQRVREQPCNAVEGLRAELAGRLSFSGSSQAKRKGQRSAVALVGPAGSGKTTTIVKLAIRLGIAQHRPVRIVSADGSRIGGADALRTFAAAMGVPFESVETPAELASILAEDDRRGLLLIDTPGFASAEEHTARGFAAVLSGHPDVDVHLVLPAAWSTRALRAAATRFRPFLPSSLLITNTDNTETLLPLVALSLELERPISWVCGGNSIPEDLLEGSADLVLGSGRKEPVRVTRISGAA